MANKLGKISVSIEADNALDRMVTTANEGFSGGRVTKMDMASFTILHFEEHCFKKCIEHIQKTYFDDVAYLDCVVQQMKKARKFGEPSPDVKSLLAMLPCKTKSPSTQSSKKRLVTTPIIETKLDSM